MRKHVLLRILGIFAIMFILSGIAMHFFEHKVNNNFQTLSESYWSISIYILSGFEDRAPVTAGGRVTSIAVLILSLALVGTVTGKIASFFILDNLRRSKMPKNLKDHIVICNWNERGDKVVKELHNPACVPEKEIVIITTLEVNEEELRKVTEYEKVSFVRGDPSLHDILRSQQVHLAKSVIILGDDTCPDPDAISALISLAITRICEEEHTKKPHIVAEVVNHRKIEHLKDAGVDEAICSVDYGLGILAQCALYEKLSEAYHQLLTYSADTNELFVLEEKEIPDEVIKNQMTFQEACDYFNKNRDPNNPAILVGVRRNIKGRNKVILNPMPNWPGPEEGKFQKFREKDALIFMAYRKPVFKK